MLRLSPLSLEGLRLCVRPEFAAMPAEDLEQIVESSVSAVPQGIAEDFMKQLGSLGKAAGPTLQRAAPDMAQGAATGASVGGPWGALIGAGAGLEARFEHDLGGSGTGHFGGGAAVVRTGSTIN